MVGLKVIVDPLKVGLLYAPSVFITDDSTNPYPPSSPVPGVGPTNECSLIFLPVVKRNLRTFGASCCTTAFVIVGRAG